MTQLAFPRLFVCLRLPGEFTRSPTYYGNTAYYKNRDFDFDHDLQLKCSQTDVNELCKSVDRFSEVTDYAWFR